MADRARMPAEHIHRQSSQLITVLALTFQLFLAFEASIGFWLANIMVYRQ